MQERLSVRRYISKQKTYYVNDSIEINPKKCAIILIDLWNESILKNLVLERVNPLIKAARKKGVLIIHAPSQRYDDIHPDLDINKDDLLITGFDNFGHELYDRQIDTLFYAGFDTLYCVLDKPLGAINYHINHPGKIFNYILIRDGVSSRCSETQALGINFFEKLFGVTTTVLELLDFFNTTLKNYTYHESNFPSYSCESKVVDRKNNFYSASSLVVLFNSSNNKINLHGVLEWAQDQGILVAQVLTDKEAVKFKGVFCVESEKKFLMYIRSNKIHDLFYAGGSLDEEMVHGVCGIMRLYIQKRYKNNPTPDYYIIRDYSWITSQPLSASYSATKDALIKHYRGIRSISFSQLKNQMTRGYLKEKKFPMLFSFVDGVRKYSLYFIGFAFFSFFLGVILTIFLERYI